MKSVCLAGGVAFNCVANGKVFDRDLGFEQVYVHDLRQAMGAWLLELRSLCGIRFSESRARFVMDHAYWGPGLYTRGRRFGARSKQAVCDKKWLAGG